ncbi:hypothetical protein [Leptospira noumeaensis]|uniref:hypothetical protein n=1 Tax=Leptospira noumeaensis TaxID=2484964 RepID=UPI001FCB1191|nr:hypothetical protein [Leptospira noumeaensis]
MKSLKLGIVLFTLVLCISGFTLSTFALNSNNTKQNEVYCKNFQSGIFVNTCSSGHSSKFKRLNGIQIQEYGSYYLREKNHWTAACAYTNTLLGTNDPEIRDYIGNSIHIKMINVTKVSYRTQEDDNSDANTFCEVKKVGEIDPSSIL